MEPTVQQVITDGDVLDVTGMLVRYGGIVAGAMAVAFAAAESIGAVLGRKKIIALFTGPLVAIVFWALGILPTIQIPGSPVAGSEGATLMFNAILAAFFGLGGSKLANLGHDKVYNPLVRRKSKT